MASETKSSPASTSAPVYGLVLSTDGQLTRVTNKDASWAEEVKCQRLGLVPQLRACRFTAFCNHEGALVVDAKLNDVGAIVLVALAFNVQTFELFGVRGNIAILPAREGTAMAPQDVMDIEALVRRLREIDDDEEDECSSISAEFAHLTKVTQRAKHDAPEKP